MTSTELHDALRRVVDERDDLVLHERALEHRAGRYSMLRIASRDIGRDDRILLLRAGIHGDEVAGPIALARGLGAIAEHAHRRGLKLIIYPLGNPSGFDARSRYNVDGDRGDCGNNAHLYYEMADGTFLDDLGDGRQFARWVWASDPRLGCHLPTETALFHEQLRQEPLRQIVAVLDLHQDHISPISSAAAYHYAFGDLSVYDGIVSQLRVLLPVLSDQLIDAGQQSGMRTNRDGFIVRHDGTLCDLFHRLGAAHAVTVETTGHTPLDAACQVNRVWIDGMIELAAHESPRLADANSSA